MLASRRALLDGVLVTHLLDERTAPLRTVREHAILGSLIADVASETAQLLPRLVESALELCDAGSAGLSLLEPGDTPGSGVFRWVALAGALRDHVGGTTHETLSPCGVCLATGSPQLYREPARAFPDLVGAEPKIVEGLVIPLRTGEAALGTIWITSHDQTTAFTSRDVAVMRRLADFATVALTLERARARAEAADRAKDQFLAMVSHELRRPSAAICGWAAMLLSGRVSPEAATLAIEAMHANALRQRDMIEDLIDASRAALGSLQLEEEVMDLSAVVQSAVDVAEVMATAVGVTVVAARQHSLPFTGDPERLHQVIGNLLDNAICHTPAGGHVSLAVEISRPWVQIVIDDSGVGLQPYPVSGGPAAYGRQHDGSTRSRGLGLGLTIAGRLAALHGGSIEGHSQGPGRGTTFIVRLPSARLLESAAMREGTGGPIAVAAEKQ